MDFYIHYTALPQGKSLADVVGELNEVLEDFQMARRQYRSVRRIFLAFRLSLTHIVF